jgi:hypothetical protein
MVHYIDKHVILRSTYQPFTVILYSEIAFTSEVRVIPLYDIKHYTTAKRFVIDDAY